MGNVERSNLHALCVAQEVWEFIVKLQNQSPEVAGCNTGVVAASGKVIGGKRKARLASHHADDERPPGSTTLDVR